VRSLEERREVVSGELRRVSLLADERAKVDVKRTEVKGREGEMRSM
jgi:DNA repair protein RAD50